MVKAAAAPVVKLNTGASVPVIGLGTWKSKPGEVHEAVKFAILEAGYRHIDGAYAYGNEEEVGKGIHDAMKSGHIKREEIFVTSKAWNTFHSRAKVTECCKESLKRLGLHYLDMYLIHWPMGYKEGGELIPLDNDGKVVFSDVDIIETWKGMEDCLKEGLVKAIGLSNFNSKQIERIIKEGTVKPSMLQVECHPYINQTKLIKYCKKHDILVTAYSPLGSPDRPMAKTGDPSLLDESFIKEMAATYRKTPAQILLKFQVQRGIITIPKSVNKERIKENIDIFDFDMAHEDIDGILAYNKNLRLIVPANTNGHPHFPFGIEF